MTLRFNFECHRSSTPALWIRLTWCRPARISWLPILVMVHSNLTGDIPTSAVWPFHRPEPRVPSTNRSRAVCRCVSAANCAIYVPFFISHSHAVSIWCDRSDGITVFGSMSVFRVQSEKPNALNILDPTPNRTHEIFVKTAPDSQLESRNF